MKQIKFFTSLATILLILLPVSMMAQITVAVDNTSTFVPTQIVNGDFGTRPFMPFKYNGTWYNTWNSSNPDNVDWTEVNPNAIGQGWNTTETHTYDHGLFEWVSGMNVYNSTLNTNGNNNGHGYFLEMNACNSAVLYQDLPTNGHDVIRWSLQHAVRTGSWADPQSMRVEIGAPQRDGSNNIVAASGVNEAVDAKIIASTKATYNASGYSGYNGYAGDYSGLSLPISYNTQWYTVTGVYSIPQGQDVTRFAFTATSTYNAGGGNLLDNITFSTIFGNLSAHQVEGDAVELKGYWGESDAAKTMKVVIGSATHTVDMSSVRGHSFTITIPAATIGSENALTVYHQDYYDARLTIYIAPTYSVELASGTANASDWSLSPTSAKSGLTVAINYNGTRTVKDVTVGRNITSTVQINSSNYSTAITNFNNTARSKLKFTGNVSNNLTLTRAEGEIDLNGYSANILYTQNNQYGYSLTIKNGSIYGVDGAGGWDDWFSGTLIFENITMTSEALWTDGHDVIIKSGTYSAVQNYKRGDTPGTVTIYGGNISAFNTTGVSAPTYHGTYTLYGGKYAFDPRGITAYTVIIPTGYAVQDNTDSDSGTYPWKVVNTNPSYAVEFENVQVVNDHQWTFTMPPYDVMVSVEYAVASVTVGETTTNYSTFASALSAWVNNSTLKLLADVTTTSTITRSSNTYTLDLNGFGIKMLSSTYGGSSTGSVFVVNNGANLTIRDNNPNPTTHYYIIPSAATNGAGLAKVVDEETYNAASGTKGTFLGGYITGGMNTDEQAYGAGIHVNGSGRLNIYGGTIIGNELTGNTTGGGGVQIEGNSDPEFYMHGGNIIGNRAAYGGAVYVRRGRAEFHDGLMKYNIAHQTCGGAVHAYGDHSTFVMSGGILSNNKAACGGALEASGSGTITLTGGSIVNNLATERGGALTNRRVNDDTHNAVFNLSGNVLISGNTRNSNAEQIFLSNTVKLNITGALSNTTSIGVAMTTPGVFTTGYNSYNSSTHPSAYFHSEMAGYTIKLTAAGEVSMASPASLTAAPTAITGLFYTGAAQALVNAGTATGGTMKYSLNNSTWSTVIPTATDAGSYTVYYKVEGDDIHTDFIPSPNTVLVTISDFQGSGTENDPYLIPSTEAWNQLCANIHAGERYTGKYFRQTADITISERTATHSEYIDSDFFEGIYDGYGHIMNLDIHETQGDNNAIATAAPFGLVRNATIKNLHVTGEVSTNNMRPASIVGFSAGNNSIINCWSEVAISSYYDKDIDAGAFVARLGNNAHFDITGCLFTGSITYSNATGYEGGGFVGWTRTGSTVTLTDCVFAPSAFTFTKTDAFYMFVGGGASHGTINNCYYNSVAAAANLTLVGPEKRISSVTGATGVTVTPVGTPTTSYDVSTISIYGNNGGLSAGGVLYGKNADAVSLNLSATNHAGYSVYDYSTNNGTLTGISNPYTLTMAAANATINVRYSTSKSIAAATTDANGWYLIASPFVSVTPSSENGFITNSYDLFRFNQNPTLTGSQYLEWENWKLSGSHYHFDLEPGRGYLYANSSNVTLTFIGTPYDGNGQVTLVRSKSNGNTDGDMLGWNLIGNPLGVTATIGDKPFYRINDNHTGIIVREDNNISPMEGIFVYAESDGEIVTFSSTPSIAKGGVRNENSIVINLNDTKGTIIDRAIVNFDKGRTLPKFQIKDNSTKLYIPQNGKDYAITFSYRIGELPMNFKAEETGVYTLSFSGENMNGISLVDMIDGAVFDLSVNDTYTFIGTSADRADRFKLVFSSPNDSNIEIFAYQTGSDIVVSGEGELQVFDVMGRMVMTQYINGVEAVEKPSTTGVYIFRLNEKSQKIVVR